MKGAPPCKIITRNQHGSYIATSPNYFFQQKLDHQLWIDCCFRGRRRKQTGNLSHRCTVQVTTAQALFKSEGKSHEPIRSSYPLLLNIIQSLYSNLFFRISYFCTSLNEGRDNSNKSFKLTLNMPVKHIHNLDEFNEVLKSPGLVVVDFTASWCKSDNWTCRLY